MDETVREEWEEFDRELQAGLEAMGLAVAEDQRQRMFEHYRRVVVANREFNLTRITSPADAAVKHYADSLSLLVTPWVGGDVAGRDSRGGEVRERIPAPAVPPEDGGARLRVLDVGTGAGFPAVPLAVVCPAWSITAIDGTGKKVRFVEQAAEALGLANVEAMHARAADLVREGDWRFDLVLVRAVGRMDKVLTETAPLLGPRGAVVFYKTAHLEQAEMDAAAAEAHKLRLKTDVHRVDLPLTKKVPDTFIEVLARQLIRFGR